MVAALSRGGHLTPVEIAVDAARWLGAALALIASALCLRAFFTGDAPAERPLRRGLLRATVGLMTLVLAARTAQLGTVPLFSPFEALYFYGWLVFLVFFLVVKQPVRTPIGTLLVPFGTACAVVGACGFTAPADVNPIFKNPLFAVHTLAAFLGYSALSVACCAGVLYLLMHDQLAKKKFGSLVARLPSLEELDRLGHLTVILGFALLTLGIAVGMTWAWREWKVVWIWEPQGAWALITWLIYAAYLVVRNGAGWRGLRAAWITTVGFVASIFTFLGTNYLMSWGRHVF
jgi:cytochrome c-type biogenesis protein CcsB